MRRQRAEQVRPDREELRREKKRVSKVCEERERERERERESSRERKTRLRECFGFVFRSGRL